jgi:hypothetical protein
MQRERFYFGNGKDDTVQEFLKKCDDPFTLGFCEGEEWFVFVDNIAITEYKLLSVMSKMEKFSSALKRFPFRKIRSLDEAKDVIEKVVSTVETSEVKETELIQRIIYQINETVLHELSIHYAGNLLHEYFISSIKFVNKSLNKEEVYNLLRKYDLKRVNIFLDHEGKEVTGLWFEEEERQSGKIRELYDELESCGMELEVGYKRKEYPIKFGLNDIKILKKKDDKSDGRRKMR